MQLQTTSPESKFPNEYSDVIFIQIDQHLKKLFQYCKNTKGSRFSESRCTLDNKGVTYRILSKHVLQWFVMFQC